MAVDRWSFCSADMVDSDSRYPRNETGLLVTPDKEQDFLKLFQIRTFSQFKDQAAAILRVRSFNPKT